MFVAALLCAGFVAAAVLLEVIGGQNANSPDPSWAERVVPLGWPQPVRVLWWLLIAAADEADPARVAGPDDVRNPSRRGEENHAGGGRETGVEAQAIPKPLSGEADRRIGVNDRFERDMN